MEIVKTAWAWFFVAIAVAEVGLSAWYHSATFLWIGTVAVLMVAYNLHRRIRLAARALADVTA
jgi:hypothetical protein